MKPQIIVTDVCSFAKSEFPVGRFVELDLKKVRQS
jgi:hypothetical protein